MQPLTLLNEAGAPDLTAEPADITLASPLLPVRALLPLHNCKRQLFRITEVHRAYNYAHREYGIAQVDYLVSGPLPNTVTPALAYVINGGGAASLRTDCSSAPSGIRQLTEYGMESMFLTPLKLQGGSLDEWLRAAAQAQIPLRVQVTGAQQAEDPVALARQWADAGVRQVAFRPADPFLDAPAAATAEAARDALTSLNALARALSEAALAVEFVGFPVEALETDLRHLAAHPFEFFQIHHHYKQAPYQFAQLMYARDPRFVRAWLMFKLAHLSHREDPVDRLLMRTVHLHPELLYKPVFLLSKALRLRGPGYAVDEWEERDIAGEEARALADFNRIFPGTGHGAAGFPPVEGRARRYFFDRTNLARLQALRKGESLVPLALERLRNEPPQLDSCMLFSPQKTMFTVMEGAQKWFSASSGERISTNLPWVELPFMISATFGGGVAELIGFRINRTQCILCPMVASSHTLLLYANEEGEYTLLRDGQPVVPQEVENRTLLPNRLPNAISLYLSVWNIHDSLSVTPVKIWSGAPLYAQRKEGIRYSIVLFCTRFSRRLQTSLLTVAHQRNYPLDQLEVLVAYVPGIDFTEDVIDTVRTAFPSLRLLHVPMGAKHERSKGYALNEALALASGDWIMLMDADILLPPNLFEEVDPLTAAYRFMAPVGRGMLSREATAKVLLGEISPWNAWDDLWRQVGEVRDFEALGVPIGFSQLFHRDCLEKVRYQEYEHFQGADWEFGRDMREHFGPEHRLPLRVLHMDHGGSQWYGVQRQF